MVTIPETTNSEVAVYTYSLAELKNQLSRLSGNELKHEKAHYTYFDQYLTALGAKTIVVESRYTDKDFLEDYAAFYVKCFEGKYSPPCGRLHFFSEDFKFPDLISGALGEGPITDEWLNKAYLGFTVIKPLPKKFIGKTCLRPYPEESERSYPVVRPYKVHLLGFELSVESLAYQEQDSVAAACASSAIWSVLHGTGILFQHRIPSPVEITRLAVRNSPRSIRDFPNAGLDASEVRRAIREVGLDPELLGPVSEDVFKGMTYAYLKAHVPLLLAHDVLEQRSEDDFRALPVGHAIALTGFRIDLNGTTPKAFPNTEFRLRSSRMTRLYAHDDQVGPFSRMYIKPGKSIKCNGQIIEYPVFLHESEQDSKMIAAPRGIFVALPHKVRIGYATVLQRVLQLYTELGNIEPTIEWDIYLSNSSEFKADIRNYSTLPKEERTQILQRSMPKYIWRAAAFAGDRLRMEAIIDATDIPDGEILHDLLLFPQ